MDKCYSTNDEEFRYLERSDVLDAMDSDGNLAEGATYYECDCETVPFTRYLSADRILEFAEDQIYDDVGEAAEDAFSTTPEAAQELDALLSAWADKHLKGQYWMCVGMSREIKVTASDVAEHAI
jgi:hypothetical protein